MTLLSDFNMGLSKGHFHAYYQPVVSAFSKEIVGYETLVRWKKNGHVLVSAAEFIEQISCDLKLLKKITISVMRDIMTDFSSLNKKIMVGKFISLNMNLPLLMDDVISKEIIRLDEFLKDKNLQLCIEITENDKVSQFPMAEIKFSKYAGEGILFAIDDFKGRCEDFDLLRVSQARITKLDKSLLYQAGNYYGLLKINNIIWILKGMGQTVIAEGVETSAEEIILENTEVDYLQGYRYGRARPYHEAVL